MNTYNRTDEELNRIIAGWAGTGSYVDGVGLIQLPMATDGQSWDFSPNYCRSLDAVHEAESKLSADQAWLYNRKLSEAHGTAGGMGSGVVDEWDWHSTARQRAEALVRVIEESNQ